MWFASNLLFLHYQSQQVQSAQHHGYCCDLLRIYYFCTINHSADGAEGMLVTVVICFEFIIFALSITASKERNLTSSLLWFASNLLFLHYQSQRYLNAPSRPVCCDLLRIYYFCTINHSLLKYWLNFMFVVICFEFIIFALSITAETGSPATSISLWFASNLLFLHYQSQLVGELEKCHLRCDLLRIYYFCTINHSTSGGQVEGFLVVICFEFIIFALSITAANLYWCVHRMLWFASNLLFLHYQSQHDIAKLLILSILQELIGSKNLGNDTEVFDYQDILKQFKLNSSRHRICFFRTFK